MSRGRNQIVLRHVRTLFDVGNVGGLTDGELLDRFEAGRGEVAELAFAVLVERHGPMVLRVCRKALRDEHAAHDAFQATFLVLARKGHSVRRRDTLGPWLHGVACRVAACARTAAARRRKHESSAARSVGARVDTTPDDDTAAAIHQEIARLPERYRRPIVLCCLEGLTREQAALQLGWRVGTVQSRLARGRDRLREVLTRRGLAPAVGTVAAALAAEVATAAVPGPLMEATVRLASAFAMSPGAVGTVPTAVAILFSGVLKTMLLQKLKVVAAASVVVTTIGVGLAWGQQPGSQGTGGFGGQSSSRADERFDLLERKIDRLIDALQGRADSFEPTDLRPLANDLAIAEATAKAALEKVKWADRMWQKKFVSEAQRDAERLALMKAEADADRARGALAQAKLRNVRRGDMATQAGPIPPTVPPPPVARDPSEPSRIDRVERRLDALEHRLDALDGRFINPPAPEPRQAEAKK